MSMRYSLNYEWIHLPKGKDSIEEISFGKDAKGLWSLMRVGHSAILKPFAHCSELTLNQQNKSEINESRLRVGL